MSKLLYTLNRKSDGKWGLGFNSSDLRIQETETNKIPIGLKHGDKITHINNISVRNKQNIINIITELNKANINSLKLMVLRNKPKKSNKEILSKHRVYWPRRSPRMKRAYPRENRIQEVDESEFSSIKSKSSSSNSQPRSRSRTRSRTRSRSNSDQQMPFMTHHFLDFGAKKKPKKTIKKKSKKKSKTKSSITFI